MLFLSLQRVLGLDSFDGVLNPIHVSGKHIVHNVFSVNKSGIVILENKAGVYFFTDTIVKAAFWENVLTHCICLCITRGHAVLGGISNEMPRQL